jgi:hypothetical protein
MNEFLSIFLNWQFLVLCGGIAAVTFVIRTTVEFAILDNPHMPGSRESRFWREFVLVILPIVLGFIFPVIARSFTYPDVIHDIYSKFLFSASAGLLSPTLYRVIKALMWKNVGDTQPLAPLPPLPVLPVPVIQNVINAPPPVPELPVVENQDPPEPQL